MLLDRKKYSKYKWYKKYLEVTCHFRLWLRSMNNDKKLIVKLICIFYNPDLTNILIDHLYISRLKYNKKLNVYWYEKEFT